MATASVTYYNGETKLYPVTSRLRKEVEARFPGTKFVKYDGYSVMIGWPENVDSFRNRDAWLPATRRIEFKTNPSLHKCDARCQNAKGHVCECSCGGKYHGINA